MGTKSLSENYTALLLEAHLTFLPAISLSLHGELSIPRGLYIVVVMKSRSSSKRKSTTGTTTTPSLQKGRGESSYGRYHTSIHRSLFYSVPKQGPFSRLLARTEPGTCAFIIFRSCICLFSFFERARERGECPVFAQQAKRAPFFFFVMAMLQLQENILRRILRSHLVPTC